MGWNVISIFNFCYEIEAAIFPFPNFGIVNLFRHCSFLIMWKIQNINTCWLVSYVSLFLLSHNLSLLVIQSVTQINFYQSRPPLTPSLLLHHQSINQETNQRNITTTAVHVSLKKQIIFWKTSLLSLSKKQLSYWFSRVSFWLDREKMRSPAQKNCGPKITAARPILLPLLLMSISGKNPRKKQFAADFPINWPMGHKLTHALLLINIKAEFTSANAM